jgi:hypothetical protein
VALEKMREDLKRDPHKVETLAQQLETGRGTGKG